MELELREASAAGVVVEFRSAVGHSLGQAVYFDWRGRAMPEVGDALCCDMVSFVSGQVERASGAVRSRHFDLQRDADGEPCVWVRIVVVVADANAPSPSPERRGGYRLEVSPN